MAYRFIQKHHQIFGLRWLFRRLNIYPNAYYNFLKNRRSSYHTKKEQILEKIKEIYHQAGGVCGHRTIRIYLQRQGYFYSKTTIYKYMNKELQLKSIVRRKKPSYKKQAAHEVFSNLLKRNFKSYKRNHKWCTDFTYIHLADGSLRYNCTILDLFDRSVVASITDNQITSNLAIKTLQRALSGNPNQNADLILHSDQGSQFTSKEFVNFCKNHNIKQSMSKSGCPYDNAPMERYFNTLKHEYINHYKFKTQEELYQGIEEFSYVYYNHIRPHFYNNYQTPFEARINKTFF